MTSYTQLTYKERCHLFRLLLKGKPISSIASAIGRHRSTLYREIERNAGLRDCYQPDRADRKAQGRKQRKSKILRCPHLLSYVDSRLRKGWSPEQIAGRLKHEESFFYACHETIYRYIYSRRGLRKRLHAHLFLAKPRRTARTTRRHRKGKFLYITPIAERPEKINQRADFGHWEADTLLFLPSFHTANLTTIVERQTRFAMALKQDNRQSTPVMTAIRAAMNRLPLPATETITFDQGSEFAHFLTLERGRKRQRRKIKTYYCDPRSPWQKGGVENFNKRLRRHLPKNFDITSLKQRAVNKIIRWMNNTPRKCLDFRTPNEAFSQSCRASI